MGSSVKTRAHPDFPKHTVKLQETAGVALCFTASCNNICFFYLPMQNDTLPRVWQEAQVTCHDITKSCVLDLCVLGHVFWFKQKW